MSFRTVSLALFLAAGAVPAVAQTPEPGSRPRMTFRFRNDFGERLFNLHRIPRLDVERIRTQALERAERVRSQVQKRGLEMAQRGRARRLAMEDRTWQRRLDLERRAVERARNQVNRLRIRPYTRKSYRFRDL